MATLQDIFNQIVNSGGNFQGTYQYQDPNAALDNMSTGYQNLSSYDMLNDYINQYGTKGLQTFSGMGNIGEGGAYGGYSYGLDNTDGNYSLTNPQFTAGQQKGSWFDENLHIIGPIILAAASAGAGAPALYDAGAGMGADGMAAMSTGSGLGGESTLSAALNGGSSFDSQNALNFTDESNQAAQSVADVPNSWDVTQSTTGPGTSPQISNTPGLNNGMLTDGLGPVGSPGNPIMVNGIGASGGPVGNVLGDTGSDWSRGVDTAQTAGASGGAATGVAGSGLGGALATGVAAGATGGAVGNVLGDTGSDWSRGVDTAQTSNTNGTTGTSGLLATLASQLGVSASDLSKLLQTGLSGLASYQNNQTANRLLDMFSRYNSDADFYGNKLRETYTNPLSYLQGPEYQSIQNVAGDYLQRKDAAGGNLANNFGRQSKLQDLAMSNLDQYRQGLSGTYQGMAGISTGQGAQGAVAASGTANAPLYRSLGQLFSTGN